MTDIQLTAKSCAGKKLAFLPKSAEEAKFIVDRLQKFGFRLNTDYTPYTLSEGILLWDSGLIYAGKDYSAARSHATLCDARQLDPDYLGGDDLIKDLFNKLTAHVDARLDAIEKKIDALSQPNIINVDKDVFSMKPKP